MAASFPGSVKSWTPVVDNVTTVLAAHINQAYEEIIALETMFSGTGPAFMKSESGHVFTSGATTHVVTDSFITATTKVDVSPTQTKIGNWSVESAAGSFTITSTATETSNVNFDWWAVKAG